MHSNFKNRYLIALSFLEAFGNKTLAKLISKTGSAEELWNASAAELYEIDGVRAASIEKFLNKRSTVSPDEIAEKLTAKNINTLSQNCEDYPYVLKQIHNAPLILFYKGDIKFLQQGRNLGIVGSRKASNYINDAISKIISDLKESGINIISGFAAGVDACAHKSALDNGLSTAGVMGCGLDTIYPASNKRLFTEILEKNGVLISEYFPNALPDTWRFPLRNRIISGLSSGVIIAEAGLKSGALITANYALEQNREVMCIPGAINNPNTAGIFELIKQGAPIVTCGDDIFENLNWNKKEKISNEKNNLIHELLDIEKKVYEILKLEPKQFDELLNESELNTNELMVTLTTLEISGLIKQLPGQRFERAYV